MKRTEKVVAAAPFIKSPPQTTGGIFKTWCDRWFVLSEVSTLGFGTDDVTTYELKYFTSQESFESGSLHKRSIDFDAIEQITSCQDMIPNHYSLCIETPGRPYYLCTKVETQRDEWIELLNRARFGTKGDNVSSPNAKSSPGKVVSLFRRVSVKTAVSESSSGSSTDNQRRDSTAGERISLGPPPSPPATNREETYKLRRRSHQNNRPLPPKPRCLSMFDKPLSDMSYWSKAESEDKALNDSMHSDTSHAEFQEDGGYVSMKAIRDQLDERYVDMSTFLAMYRSSNQAHDVAEIEAQTDNTKGSTYENYPIQSLGYSKDSKSQLTEEVEKDAKLPNDSNFTQRNSSASQSKEANDSPSEREDDDPELEARITRALSTHPTDLNLNSIKRWLDDVLSESTDTVNDIYDTKL